MGRIHPLDDVQVHLSPAVAIFRDDRLLDALRADVERVRTGRRGVLRIAQSELENMFFTPTGGSAEDATPAEPLERAAAIEAGLRSELEADGGLDETELEAWLRSFESTVRAAGSDRGPAGELVAAFLDRAAFDTGCDLGKLRDDLHRLWDAHMREARERKPADLQPAKRTPTSAAGPLGWFRAAARRAREGTELTPETEGGADRAKVQAALAEFDQARAAGADLEQLFQSLEKELGLESDEDDAEDSTPKTPGAVGALVAEFLWELGREDPERARDLQGPLGTLANRHAAMDCIEDLTREGLLMAALDAPAEVVPALAPFAKWIEENHDHPLWTLWERTHEELQANLERVEIANRELAAAGESTRVDRDPLELVENLASGELGVNDEASEFRPVVIPTGARGHLRGGDWARLDTAGGTWTVRRVWPAAFGPLLREGTRAN